MSGSNRGGKTGNSVVSEQQNDSNGSAAGNEATNGGKHDTGPNETSFTKVGDGPPTVTPKTQSYAEIKDRREQQDLQAQQDMAFYAMLMLVATIAMTIVTAVGVILVKRTLDATLNTLGIADRTNEISQGMVEETQKSTAAAIEAAQAGREANEIARQSAEAGREANEISRSSIDRQTRPWLLFHEIGLRRVVETNQWEVAVIFKNFGVSPALYSTIFTAWHVQTQPEPISFGEIPNPLPEANRTVVEPNGTAMSGFFQISEDQAFNQWLFVNCITEYRTAFDDEVKICQVSVRGQGVRVGGDQFTMRWMVMGEQIAT